MRCKLLFIILILLPLVLTSINSEDTFIEPVILQEINDENIPVIVELETPIDELSRIQELQSTDVELQKLSETEYATTINEQELQDLLDDPNVISIKEDDIATILLTDSVPLINASVVQAKQYSSTNLTGKGQSICVIDTGVNSTHPGLAGRVIAQKCFCDATDLGLGGCCADTTNEANVATDDHGHGTHVAGIVAGNGSSITGVAPEATIVAVKVTNSAGTGLFSDITQAITWCTDNASLYNISVITISLGGGSFINSCDSDYESLSSAIYSAWTKNVSVTIATGNSGYTNNITAPACINKSIAVSATTKADAVWSSSNRNQITDMMAPGASITSLDFDGTTESRSGTSMAAPHVAGAIALLQQYKINVEGISLTSQEINDTITTNGTTINDAAGSGKIFTRLDVLKSLWAVDLLSPVLINENTTDQTLYIYNNVTFIINTTEINPNTVWIESNWTGTTSNYTMTSNNNIQYNYTISNSSFNVGSFQWRIYANDSHNNINVTSWHTSTILSGSPIISLYTPENLTNTNNNSLVFNFTVIDDYTLVPNCSLYLNSILNQTKNITNGTTGQFTVNLPDNTYLWNIACNDSDQLIGNSSLRKLIVDITKPTFSSETFTTPLELGDNQTYSVTITDLYTTYANFSYLENNYTLTNTSNIFTKTFQPYQNGTNLFTTYAKDFAGNINSSLNNFTVRDTITGPRILNILYTSSLTQNSDQNITAWILDANSISAAYISINGTNYSMSNTTSYYFTYTFSATTCGSTEFKIFANDTLNQGITNSTNYTVTTCCGDGTCNNAETCSSCSRDCGTCTTTTTTTTGGSGGGGGGGGSGTTTTNTTASYAPTLVTTITETIAEASATQPIEIQIANTEIPVTNLFIEVNNNLQNVEINVETLSEKPSELPTIEGTIYKYLEFTLSNISDENINNAIISFNIPSSWFIENQIDKTTVKLNRYTTSWETLPTELTDENNDIIYYTANTTGFSYYAITGNSISSPSSSETQFIEEKSNLWWIITISIIAFLIILGLILFLVHEHNQPNI